MSIDSATFVVQRGDEQFSCLGSELDAKLQDDDLMICQVGDTHASATRKTILNSERLFTDPEVDGFDATLIDSLPPDEPAKYIYACNKAFYALTVDPGDYQRVKIYKSFDLSDTFELVKTVRIQSAVRSCLFFTWVHNKFVFSFRGSSATWYYYCEWSGSKDDEVAFSRDVFDFGTAPIAWKSNDNITYGYDAGKRYLWVFNSKDSVLDVDNWIRLDIGKTADNDQIDSPENVYYSKELDVMFASGGNSAMWVKSLTGLTGHGHEVFAYYATTAYSRLNYIAAKPGLSVAANDSSWTSIYWTDQDPVSRHTWNKVDIGSAFRVKYLTYEPVLGLFFINDANGKVWISRDAITWEEVTNGTNDTVWSDDSVCVTDTGQILVADLSSIISNFTAYFTGYYYKESGVPDDSLFVVTDGDEGHKSVTGAQVKALFVPKPFSVMSVEEPKRRRARNADGTFKADDPCTPDINEAWEN